MGMRRRRDILLQAGIDHAEGLIISSSSVPASAVVQASRELNPTVRILTRAAYLAQSASLRNAGDAAVFSSEGEIALSMADFLMEQLGPTNEQIDRERGRVRQDFFGTTAFHLSCWLLGDHQHAERLGLYHRPRFWG